MNTTNRAKTILCYGDSNTWGANPKDGTRYPRSTRWPYVLQSLLGSRYEVISEGLCGRTLVAEDPNNLQRTGISHLQSILESHDPVNLVVIMLGTNDIKSIYNLEAREIAKHLEETVEFIRSKKVSLSKRPKILIVCPPSPVTPKSGSIYNKMSRWPELFKTLPALYASVAKKKKCLYIDAGDYITSSRVDGFHLDPMAHKKLASVVAELIRKVKI